MTKTEALKLLGGPAKAAAEIGITPQAVGQWPEVLTAAIRDRVQAALARQAARERRRLKPAELGIEDA